MNSQDRPSVMEAVLVSAIGRDSICCRPSTTPRSITGRYKANSYQASGVIWRSVSALICAVLLAGTVDAKEPSKEQQREDIRKATADTLSRLYDAQPSAKKAIQRAAGYAVFSNVGIKIFVAGGGKGKGMAVDNVTGKETFMRMVEVQAGLGMGVKKFRVVFVFEDRTALNKFIDSGWQVGGQATAAAKASGEGGAFAGAMSISPGVWMYQLTDAGLALELTGKGTKYYKDENLN